MVQALIFFESQYNHSRVWADMHFFLLTCPSLCHYWHYNDGARSLFLTPHPAQILLEFNTNLQNSKIQHLWDSLVSSTAQNNPDDFRICLTYIVLSRPGHLLQHRGQVRYLHALLRHFPLSLQLVNHLSQEALPCHRDSPDRCLQTGMDRLLSSSFSPVYR